MADAAACREGKIQPHTTGNKGSLSSSPTGHLENISKKGATALRAATHLHGETSCPRTSPASKQVDEANPSTSHNALPDSGRSGANITKHLSLATPSAIPGHEQSTSSSPCDGPAGSGALEGASTLTLRGSMEGSMADSTEMCTTWSTSAGQFHQPDANPTAALTKQMGASLCASASTHSKKLSLKDGVNAAPADPTDSSVEKLTEDPREPLDRRAWIDRRISRGELVLTIPPSSASPVLVAVEETTAGIREGDPDVPGENVSLDPREPLLGRASIDEGVSQGRVIPTTPPLSVPSVAIDQSGKDVLIPSVPLVLPTETTTEPPKKNPYEDPREPMLQRTQVDRRVSMGYVIPTVPPPAVPPPLAGTIKTSSSSLVVSGSPSKQKQKSVLPTGE